MLVSAGIVTVLQTEITGSIAQVGYQYVIISSPDFILVAQDK